MLVKKIGVSKKIFVFVYLCGVIGAVESNVDNIDIHFNDIDIRI